MCEINNVSTSVVLIVCMPYTIKNLKIPDYKLYDDFTYDYFCSDLVDNLSKNIKICINDPHLCIPKIFDKLVDDILIYTKKENITLFIFDNDIDSCIHNAKTLGYFPHLSKLKKISFEYNINYYLKKEFKIINLPVKRWNI